MSHDKVIEMAVTGTGTGTCSLTGKQADGLTVRFKDGTVDGFLSHKAFQQLLKMKLGQNGKVPDALPVNGDTT